MNKFHQQKVTIVDNYNRRSIFYHRDRRVDTDTSDYKLFYKVSDSCIMMMVRHNSGKNKNKCECVKYSGHMKNDTFVIREPEPKEEAIWFDNYKAFEQYINNKGLTEFSIIRRNNTPTLDDTIPTLWEDFKDLNKEHLKVGCWETTFVNARTGEEYSTNGDICEKYSWKDYFIWLVNDIEEMDIGELKDIRITDVCYRDKDF